MAVHISSLRLFLSLIQELVPDKKKENYGIEPLPNLETKFICADTLIGLKKGKQKKLELPIVKATIKQLLITREQHLIASNPQEKKRLQEYDEKLRHTLSIAMEDAGDLSHDTAELLLQWNPYTETKPAPFFDPQWMFGVEKFDIVIGNPPYGAKYPPEHKKYFKEHYESAKTIQGKQKGSLDTFSLFIENGFNVLKTDGYLNFIVPIAITSSDSMAAIHKLLETNCSLIKIASFSVRPQPIFENAVVNTSILFFLKDGKKNKRILATKMYRKNKNFNLQHLVNNLQFIDIKEVKLVGRYPKISLAIEKSILKKIFSQEKTIKDLIEKKGNPIYYRTTGGRYFKIITNYSTGSTKEKIIQFDKKYANAVGAILSSNLFFWFYQIFSNNLDLKTYEIQSFGVPKLEINVIKKLEKIYIDYLIDIEKNATTRQTENYANISSFKEYKISKSKHLIDQIDDIICPLYGLTDEERDFIKNYEINFRTDE
jgi:methylase of polypeptide subunit release factors